MTSTAKTFGKGTDVKNKIHSGSVRSHDPNQTRSIPANTKMSTFSIGFKQHDIKCPDTTQNYLAYKKIGNLDSHGKKKQSTDSSAEVTHMLELSPKKDIKAIIIKVSYV